MLFSEYVAKNRDEYVFNSEGQMEITIDSSMLYGINVDTYSTFTGDSWTESTINYVSSYTDWLDYPVAGDWPIAELDWEDINVVTDHDKVLKSLSESAAEHFIDEFPFIKGYKIESVFSPAAYNFATDSFDAKWTIDIDEMIEEFGDENIADIESWAQKEYESCSGFISHIPGYFENKFSWAIVWAYLQKNLTELDYDGTYGVLEDEHEIYEEASDWTIEPSGYRKVYEHITGTDAPKSVIDEDSLLAALPSYQDEVLF